MYTLVQHSGYGYGHKPGFKQGLESREVKRKGDINRVRKLGGYLFENYAEAEEAAHKLMYPPDGVGPRGERLVEEGFYLYPRFKGTFSDAVVDGLRIAIRPMTEDEHYALQRERFPWNYDKGTPPSERIVTSYGGEELLQ